jgi:uncharacterized membrane protein
MRGKKPIWLSAEEEQEILDCIRVAEQTTSGEIRVHLESMCKTVDPLDRAAQIFYRLGMEKTQHRNGILLYLSVDDHKIALIGDSGINRYACNPFWENTCRETTECLRNSGLCKGICLAIRACAVILAQHFPKNDEDTDELPNDISISN